MPLMFVLFRCRLIPSLFSGSLLTGMDFLETRLLFPTIPVIPVPSLLLRAGLPVEVGTEVFLSLIELPIREDMLELIRLPELPACGCVLRTLGLLVLIELPMREDLLELMRLPKLADVCFPAPELTVVGFLLPIVMLEGLRVPEVIPGRLVTGRLTVILPG